MSGRHTIDLSLEDADILSDIAKACERIATALEARTPILMPLKQPLDTVAIIVEQSHDSPEWALAELRRMFGVKP